MITFTEQDALNGLRQAATGRGASYTYPSFRCVYVDNVNGALEPSCMVGYALACMGVPLRLVYESGCNPSSIHQLSRWLSCFGYHFNDEAIAVLGAAQEVQDRGASFAGCGCMVCVAVAARGNTWGDALAAAVSVSQRNNYHVAVATNETSINTAAANDVMVNDVINTAEAITSDAALATV